MTIKSSTLPERKDCTCECHINPALKHSVYGCCRGAHDLEWRKKEQIKRALELPVRVRTTQGRFVFRYGASTYMCVSLADVVKRVQEIVGLNQFGVRRDA